MGVSHAEISVGSDYYEWFYFPPQTHWPQLSSLYSLVLMAGALTDVAGRMFQICNEGIKPRTPRVHFYADNSSWDGVGTWS